MSTCSVKAHSLTMTFGGLSVYLPGYGAASTAAARSLAAALIAGADEVDALLQKESQPELQETEP
jgi:hypothetical protein